jgi:hypothetical protein
MHLEETPRLHTHTHTHAQLSAPQAPLAAHNTHTERDNTHTRTHTHAHTRTRSAPQAPLAARTVDFLMPPQAKSKDAKSQSIYRGHMGRVVFVAFLSDNTTAVSVDELGTTNLWPAQEAGRTGFGWFQPSASWSLPRQLKTWRAWWVCCVVHAAHGSTAAGFRV